YLSSLLLAALCLGCCGTFAQNWSWAKADGGLGNDVATTVAVDEQGNSYLSGYMDGPGMFNNINYQGFGVLDVFIAKYDAQGNFQWALEAGGDGDDRVYEIRYRQGYLFICGSFEDTARF